MSNLEKKVDALIRLCTAGGDESLKKSALDELEALMNEAPASADAESVIRTLLMELGVPEHILGHGYIVTALKALLEDPSLLHEITGRLYPLVAVKHGTTGSRAERAIRHAIEVAWERMDLETMIRRFGCTVNPNKGKPTNSEFLARCSSIVRERMRGE